MSPAWRIAKDAPPIDAAEDATEAKPAAAEPVPSAAPVVPSFDVGRGANPLDTQRRLAKTKPEVAKKRRAVAAKQAATEAAARTAGSSPAPSGKKTGLRRKGREMAMQMLFQADLGKQTPEQVRATFWASADKVEEVARGFADDLFRVATTRAPEIDALIEAHSANWRLPRMPAVDRNLLRAATAELLGFPGTPVPIVINESLEIARRYCAPESINFLNAVLDAISRSRT